MHRLLNWFLGVPYCLIWAGFIQDAFNAWGLLAAFGVFILFDLTLRWPQNFQPKRKKKP